MITSVTGVTRNAGIDLPTPARAPAPPPAAEQPGPAVPGATRDAQAGRTPQAAAAEKHGDQPEEHHPAPDDQSAADTSRYLADLLTSRIIGGAVATTRPPHITPERLSSLISYLEASLRPAPGSPRDPAATRADADTAASTPKGVDVTS